ncbi:hypothetical protein GCM10027072_43220 [Streptomyces bullii]
MPVRRSGGVADECGARHLSGAAPRSRPSGGSAGGQTASASGSVPVRAARAYQWALDFGVRSSVT